MFHYVVSVMSSIN